MTWGALILTIVGLAAASLILFGVWALLRKLDDRR